jgi:hypothetical protein
MSNLPIHFVQQFGSNIQLSLQQKDSRLGDKVASGQHSGEKASPVDFVGALEMDEILGRNEPKTDKNAAVDRRWVVPVPFDLNQIIGDIDKAQMLADPTNSRVMAAVAAAKRRKDRTIMNAFFADAITGKDATSTTAFTAGNVVAVGHGATGNVGMTVKKMREAKRLLMSYDLDLESEELFMAVTADEHDDLLAEAQVVSTDFNDKPVLVEGKIVRFLGVNLVHTQLVLSDASSYHRCPMWAKSGMYFGNWIDMKTNISQRNDLKDEPWQAYLKVFMGATRLEENKVIEIKCA